MPGSWPLNTIAPAQLLLLASLLAPIGLLLVTLLRTRHRLAEQGRDLAVTQTQHERLLEDYDITRAELSELHTQLRRTELEALEAQLGRDALVQQQDQRETQHAAELERLDSMFRRLSEQVLAQQGEQQSQALSQLLSPLQVQLETLERGLTQQRAIENQAQSALVTEVKALRGASARVGQEALRLSTLLDGGTAQQGQWGEVVLERLLEDAGLRAGQDFLRQAHCVTTDGTAQRPDVLIKLPDDVRLVIDAKVSVADFQRAQRASDPEQRRRAQKRHAQRLADHARTLGRRDYPGLDRSRFVPLVLMFVPLDAAVAQALETAPQLYDDAYREQVLLVSPQTLYATLLLVRTLWRQRKLTDNVAAVAAAGRALVTQIDQLGRELAAAERHAAKTHRAIARLPERLQAEEQGLLATARKLEGLGIS
ncbi:MAG: DNA recombination protein RmuC [Pseudomonadota bacterium]